MWITDVLPMHKPRDLGWRLRHGQECVLWRIGSKLRIISIDHQRKSLSWRIHMWFLHGWRRSSCRYVLIWIFETLSPDLFWNFRNSCHFILQLLFQQLFKNTQIIRVHVYFRYAYHHAVRKKTVSDLRTTHIIMLLCSNSWPLFTQKWLFLNEGMNK